MSHSIRLCVLLLAICSAVAAVGCGGVPVNSSPVSTPPTSSSRLAGNWLLYGSLPQQPSILAPQSQGLAMDIEVIGDQILASARLQGSCSTTASFGITYADVLTGTIGSDGTFTISSPSQSTIASIVIKGSLPAIAGASWPGIYSVSFSGLGSCSVSQGGAFNATSVAPLTGTYTGSGSLYPLSGGTTPTAVTAMLTLQQGSPIYLNGVPTTSSLGLGGSVKVQGISCFSSGTVSTASPSLLEGNQAVTYFAMNDGSTLQIMADITDTGTNTLAVNSLYVPLGACAGLYRAVASPFLLSR